MSATTPYWLLDDVCGWRGETTGFSVAGGGRDLTVDALPGLAADLPKGLKGTVQHPVALCAGPSDTDLYVLEEAGNVIRLLNLGGHPRAQTLPGMGGRGSAVRKFNSPRGLATLSDGSIAVSDTKNNRVQIFTPISTRAYGRVDGRIHAPPASRSVHAMPSTSQTAATVGLSSSTAMGQSLRR